MINTDLNAIIQQLLATQANPNAPQNTPTYGLNLPTGFNPNAPTYSVLDNGSPPRYAYDTIGGPHSSDQPTVNYAIGPDGKVQYFPMTPFGNWMDVPQSVQNQFNAAQTPPPQSSGSTPAQPSSAVPMGFAPPGWSQQSLAGLRAAMTPASSPLSAVLGTWQGGQ